VANAAIWVVDPATSTVALRNITILRHEPGSVVVGDGLAPGDTVVTAACRHCALARRSACSTKSRNGVNLSAWALSHRSFIIFVMIASMVAGAVSYSTLGRNEDPPFTFRTMVVQANWPGATLEETVEQVTERSSASCRRSRTSTSCAATPRRA